MARSNRIGLQLVAGLGVVALAGFGTGCTKSAGGAVQTPVAAPVFSTQPVNLTVAQGGTATFSVVATGNGTLSYQWTKGGVNVPNAAGATLVIPGIQVTDADTYAC